MNSNTTPNTATQPSQSLEELRRICSRDNTGNRKLEAAKFYRDRLGWAIHPLCGPNANRPKKERGKAPLCKGWRRWRRADATDQVLEKHFRDGSELNLGVVVRGPQVCVDLDSKPDRGESVRAWLSQHPELNGIPRERTAGGVHLHFRCRDLPPILKNGKPRDKALTAPLNEKVMAELYFDGLNIVVSPSVHPEGPVYEWEVTGEIPEVSWKQLQDWFGFKRPDDSEDKERQHPSGDDWWRQYEGDLKTLNLASLFSESEMLGKTINPDKGTIAVKCPWFDEHSGKEAWDSQDSSTTIFIAERGEGFPGFSCLHSHCSERALKDVLAWFEERQPGCVDAHCTRKRIWVPGQTAEDGRPRLILPGIARPVSAFATEAGILVAGKDSWYLKNDEVVVVDECKTTDNISFLGFKTLKAAEACTAIEEHIETGFLKASKGKDVFVSNSMTEQAAKLLLNAPQFRRKLQRVTRILDVPIPIVLDGLIVVPKLGYDERFATYCEKNAPAITVVSLEEAKQYIKQALTGFCWVERQDLVHAIARLLTPYCRGLMGWSARFPLWFFEANRPRAGKDYLSGVTMIVHQGAAFGDAPLAKDDEETRKRITSAIKAGRRGMHFANCRGHLDSKNLEEAITGSIWADRLLGGNAEVKLPNEVEFSLSANGGLTYTPDFEPRIRKIRLGFPQEDPNSRRFENPNLHYWVKHHRSEILSACQAFVREWDRQGRPAGPTPFSSFPEWARVVGGIMNVCNLGDPCLANLEAGEVGGDRLTAAMRALFQLCYDAYPDQWIEKQKIYDIVQQNQADCETLEFFGDLSGERDRDGKSPKTRLGMRLSQFVNRVLGDIQLKRTMSAKRTERAQFRFTKASSASDNGAAVLQGLFSDTRTPSATPPAGDPGDLGDLLPAQNNEESEKKKKSDEPPRIELSVGCENAPKGHQGHQPAPRLVVDRNGLTEAVGAFKRSPDPIALDIETYGNRTGDSLNSRAGNIRLLSLAVPGCHPWLLDLKAIGYDLGEMKAVLEEAEIIGHNLKFDALWLRTKCGIALKRMFCCMTASRLLTAGTDHPNDLGECLRRHLQIDLPKDQGASNWGGPLTPQQVRYAADDVCYLHSLKSALETDIERNGLRKVLDLELALLPVVVEMEARGIFVNRADLASIKEDAEQDTRAHRDGIRDLLMDPEFNPLSAAQVLKQLRARGQQVQNTTAETLAGCPDRLAKMVLDYREAKKRAEQATTLIKSTGADGRIHASFNPLGAKTGRFSSSEPNLQSVNRGQIRKCFRAAPGFKLVVADYSQIELRVAAAIAGEKRMLEAYAKNADLHLQTASLVTGKPMEQIDKESRQLAKAVNFGLLYGQCPKGLVRYAKTSYGVELSEQQAVQFRQRFFDAYQSLRAWHQSARAQANASATEVRTKLSRRRLLPRGLEANWERFTALVNTPVQGSCADALKLAMVDLAERLHQGAGIVSTVHDELIVEAPENVADEVKLLVEQCMVQAMGLLFPGLPVVVEAKVCTTWDDK